MKVSGEELRRRLRERLDTTRLETPADLLSVLALKGSQDLLSLIASHVPGSISELAELAGRRQPNVSRSLSALIGTGLVEIQTLGRRSAPRLTELGHEKALEYGLLPRGGKIEAPVEVIEPRLFSIMADPSTGEAGDDEGDALPGRLIAMLRLRGAERSIPASATGDLHAMALRVVDQWWRLLYRRDDPFKLTELRIDQGQPFALIVKSHGPRVELLSMAQHGLVMLDNGFRWMSPAELEASLLEELVQPVVRAQQGRGLADRLLESRMKRVMDSRAYREEASFCRTAGALGLSPYELPDSVYQQVRQLMALIADEESRLDFASAVLASELEESQAWTLSELTRKGESNALPGLPRLRERCLPVSNRLRPDPTVAPWEIATDLARAVRADLGMAADVRFLGVSALAQAFGADQDLQLSGEGPGALRAFQAWQNDAPTVIVEDEGGRTSFLLARAIGDYLAYGSHAACIADIYTDRQAVGRAFAAELLAPAEGVIQMVNEGEPLNRIAQHYQVGREVVTKQYENNSWR